ncbi:DUF4426 domain-containing protein [Nitrincola schmidtii]|uniref:DUF4426 domain-containing protein n=1 Tax=Nitrincola schmidtii TaxID=1730894 RepID=UPI00124E2F7E|nr:DUF4426 domain-containing protein [Nitrincola schmidtii]
MFKHLKTKTYVASAIALALSLGIISSAQAEQMFSDERYEIHYNAFNSTLIPAEVASRHGLTRSGNRGLINIAVLEKQEDGSTQPVSAEVSGDTRNIVQQRQNLIFNEVEEANAIYSISSFQFTNEDLLTITLSVKPESSEQTYTIELQQTFYVD